MLVLGTHLIINLDKMTNLIHVINLIEHGNLPSKDIIKLIEYYNGI